MKFVNQVLGFVFVGLAMVVSSSLILGESNPLALFNFVYEKVGFISLALTAMTVVLVYLTYYLLSTDSVVSYPKKVVRVLSFLRDYSTQVGLLGTVLGAIAMITGLSGDAEQLQSHINDLLFGIGMAMYSTAWGLSIHMAAAGLMDWKEITDIVQPNPSDGHKAMQYQS